MGKCKECKCNTNLQTALPQRRELETLRSRSLLSYKNLREILQNTGSPDPSRTCLSGEFSVPLRYEKDPQTHLHSGTTPGGVENTGGRLETPGDRLGTTRDKLGLTGD